MTVEIKLRRDTAANWTSADPTLALGEVGLETDTRQAKFGDGSTAWTGLDYMVAPDSSALTTSTTFSGDADGLYNALVVDTMSEDVNFSGDATITTTGTLDDYAVSASISVLRWNGASALTLSGMQGGADGRAMFILNVTAAQTLTLKHAATSSAGNQFYLEGGANLDLPAFTGTLVIYDATSTKWRSVLVTGVAAHAAAADPHTGYLKEADIAAKGDLFAGTADNTVGILTVGTNGQRLTPKSGDTPGIAWQDDEFTVGGALLDPTGARTIEVWRAPFACEVVGYRARVVGGTNAVTNAQVDSTDLLTGDLTTTPGDGWEAGTIKSDGTEDITAGEVVKLEVVSISGAVTEISWTITLRRAA